MSQVCDFPFKRLFSAPPATLDAVRGDHTVVSREKYTSPIRISRETREAGTLGVNTTTMLDGKYCLLKTDKTSYEMFDWMTDFFTEEARMRARRSDAPESPMEYWNKNRNALIAEFGEDFHAMREAIYKRTKECTQFKVSLAFTVIAYTVLFGEKMVDTPLSECWAQPVENRVRWLDMSAGWGDRLIAALALGDRLEYYHAFDPNLNLRAGHSAIIDKYADDSLRERVKIEYTSFEDANLHGARYNLAFSSPPFFNLEIYDNGAGQSVVKYPKFLQWQREFLYRSLAKMWSALEPEGTMVIHLSDIGVHRICETMLLWCVRKLPGAKFRGAIGSIAESGKPRPLWVFTKNGGNTRLPPPVRQSAASAAHI